MGEYQSTAIIEIIITAGFVMIVRRDALNSKAIGRAQHNMWRTLLSVPASALYTAQVWMVSSGIHPVCFGTYTCRLNLVAAHTCTGSLHAWVKQGQSRLVYKEVLQFFNRGFSAVKNTCPCFVKIPGSRPCYGRSLVKLEQDWTYLSLCCCGKLSFDVHL